MIGILFSEPVSQCHFLRIDKMLAYIHTLFENDPITGFILLFSHLVLICLHLYMLQSHSMEAYALEAFVCQD